MPPSCPARAGARGLSVPASTLATALVAALAGATSGAIGVVVYWRLSNQERIRDMKREARARRSRLGADDILPGEAVRLALANLRQALVMLGRVAPPALAGGAVMVPAILWLDARAAALPAAETWYGGWELPFIAGALAAALAVKFAFKVE